MSQQIHHRNLEQCIGVTGNCDDYLKLKIAGYYPRYNDIVIAARRGIDRYFLAARDRKSDILEAIPLDSRYLVIGDINDVDERIFYTCVLQNKADTWLEVPDRLYLSRLLIAGAVRVITVTKDLPIPLARSPEYRQALLENRVIEIVC